MIAPPFAGILEPQVLAEFESWFRSFLQELSLPPRLASVYEYTLFAPGKRFRPQLTLFSARYLALPPPSAFPLAAAVEMIHTYSLIHDDLRAMDDAALRRGRAAAHRKFGEALAILAGDGLLTDAFYVITHTPAPPSSLLLAIRELASAAGGKGMVAGQVGDLYELAASPPPELSVLKEVHERKTGALIRASLLLPFWAFAPEHPELPLFQEYARVLGLFYQIGDDLLDAREETGKDAFKDAGKVTYRTFFTPQELEGICEEEKGRIAGKLSSLPEKVQRALMALLEWTLKRER